jgi:peptide deformylase
MILPIVAYGDTVLRKKSVPITPDYPELEQLLINMRETMKNAQGVGLAAPQIGKAIRLFIIDLSPFAEDEELDETERNIFENFDKVFINAELLEETGDEWAFNEGCLSIPEIREDVFRQPEITIKYLDEQFEEHTEVLKGIPARVVQHEYDHIEGVLFTDKISSLKKRLIKKKLENISKGKINPEYRMRFPLAKR